MTKPPKGQYTEEEEELLIDAEFLLEEGRIEAAESEYAKALELYNQAMEIFRRVNKPKGIVHSLLEIARVQLNRGDTKQSIASLQQAIAITEEDGLPLLKAEALALCCLPILTPKT